jgi:SOS-response transcriptional repressor LexA
MPRPPGRTRSEPAPLTRRQQEWLDASRAHYERTGTAASRMEFATAMGCISGAAAAYGCEILEKKGYLVQIHAPNGSGSTCRRRGPGMPDGR